MWKLISKTGAVVAALALPLAAAVPASAEIAPGEPPNTPIPGPSGGGLPLDLSMVTSLPMTMLAQLAGITSGAGLGGVGLPTGVDYADGGISTVAELTEIAKETDVRDLSELAEITGDEQVAQLAELGAPMGIAGLGDLLALASLAGVSDLGSLVNLLALLGGGAGLPALPGLPSLPLPV